MIKGFSLGGYRISIFVRKIVVVDGIKSILPDGQHAIMMDCENCSLRQLEQEIWRLQNKYRLGSADILQSSDGDHFHVYIWSRVPLRRLIRIMLDCRYEDWKHIFFTMKRKHSVLRLTAKSGSQIAYLQAVSSPYVDTCSHKDFRSFVRYQTANRVGGV